MGKKIVIIGGGVIGMSTAFHLANNGIKDITIIEKDSIGSGSSSQAAGIVTCLQWNATSVASGKYFAVVSAPNGFTDTVNMTLIK